jgi:hypothetical protein
MVTLKDSIEVKASSEKVFEWLVQRFRDKWKRGDVHKQISFSPQKRTLSQKIIESCPPEKRERFSLRLKVPLVWLEL